MAQFFLLPVVYKKEQLHFRSSLVRYGYSYKFNVEINGKIVLFESDEEGGYRDLVENRDFKIDKPLLEEISLALSSLHDG